MKNSGIVDVKIENGKCISLIHKDDPVNPFELKTVDCEEKRQVLCSKDVPKVKPAGSPNMFPCMVNKRNRKKREAAEHEICDEEEDDSVLDKGKKCKKRIKILKSF